MRKRKKKMVKCRRLEENGDKRIKKNKNGGKRMMIVIRLDQGEGKKMLNKKEMKGFFFYRNRRLRYKKCERKVLKKEGKF